MYLKGKACIGFNKVCRIKLRFRCWYNTLQHLRQPLKLLTVWVQSLPIPGMGKDRRNLRVRVKTLSTSHITVLMWQVVILAQFLWNWVKQLSNIGPAEVHIININALTTLVLLLAHARRKIKTKKL